MIDRDQAEHAVGTGVLIETETGDRLGPVRRVFLDDYTGWPSFATVTLGVDPYRETFVALHQADLDADRIVVPYTLDMVNNAPTVGSVDSLTTQQEDDLFDYYGVPIDGVIPVVSHLGDALNARPGGKVSKTDPSPD